MQRFPYIIKDTLNFCNWHTDCSKNNGTKFPRFGIWCCVLSLSNVSQLFRDLLDSKIKWNLQIFLGQTIVV